MNRSGIFITFMVFLLVASVLTLHEATKKTDFRQEKAHIEETAFNNVNNAFNNLYEEVVSLNKEGFGKEIQQRAMPFGYDFEKNSIILSQRLPTREASFDAYFDAINIYSIFANADDTTDLEIGTSTIQSEAWGGTEEYPDLNYAILPQCLLYDINACCADGSIMILKELEDGELGCVGGFDYADLNAVDVNILVDSRGCSSGNIQGNLAGKDEAYDPLEEKPYLTITVNESNINCPGSTCYITESGTETIRTHFDPEDSNPEDAIDSLAIYCDAEEWLSVKIGKEDEDDEFPFVAFKKSVANPVVIDLNVSFDQKVELFYFTSFAISVHKDRFPVRRST